jgi:hypothetical protein
MSQNNIISWSEWEKTYIPVPNPDNGDNQNLWDCLFDFYQPILDMEVSPYQVWTLVDNNPNSVYLDIVPGHRVFNRIGFFVTAKIWADEEMTVSNDPSYA